MEPATGILAKQAQIVDPQGPGQHRRDMRPKLVQHPARLIRGQPVGQGHVKAEFLHHERIAPAVQQLALAFGQTVGAAAGHLGLGQRRAQRVGGTDNRRGKGPQCGTATDGGQGKKPLQVFQPQPGAGHRPKPRRQDCHGIGDPGRTDPRAGAERRAQRGVKAIATGVAGDGCDIGI